MSGGKTPPWPSILRSSILTGPLQQPRKCILTLSSNWQPDATDFGRPSPVGHYHYIPELMQQEQAGQVEMQAMQTEVQVLRAKVQASQAEVQALRAKEQTSRLKVRTLRAQVRTLRADLVREEARAKKGPAPATEALFEALAAYIDSGQDLEENMRPGTLAQATAAYAQKINLPSAHLLKPEGGTAHTLMNAALRGLRHSRKYDRK